MKLATLKMTVVLVLAAFMLAGTAYAASIATPNDETVASSAFIANIIDGFPELALTPDVVQALRDADYGWGEIVIACSIAVNSGTSLDEVLALATEGAGWGEIAKQLGVPNTAFGQYVRGIIGKGGAKVKAQNGRKQLDDAAAMDMVQDRFGLQDDDVQALAAAGLDVQDVLCAVSITASAGDASRIGLVLQLRVEQHSWLAIAEAVGVGKDGVVEKGVAIRNQVEFKNALKEQIRARAKLQGNAEKQQGKPEDTAKGKGSSGGSTSGSGKGEAGGTAGRGGSGK
ncbi:MAG: hypothetical protein ACM3X3_02045 [Betaproteobacteria bacterium]